MRTHKEITRMAVTFPPSLHPLLLLSVSFSFPPPTTHTFSISPPLPLFLSPYHHLVRIPPIGKSCCFPSCISTCHCQFLLPHTSWAQSPLNWGSNGRAVGTSGSAFSSDSSTNLGGPPGLRGGNLFSLSGPYLWVYVFSGGIMKRNKTGIFTHPCIVQNFCDPNH